MRIKFRGSLNFTEAGSKARAGLINGLEAGMEHVLQEARVLVPNEEGDLEQSGVASVDPSSLTGAVSFDTPYAVRQHEELSWRHSDGGTAKYLERPMNSNRDVVLDLVAAQVRRALR